jgi:hypothetical protein
MRSSIVLKGSSEGVSGNGSKKICFSEIPTAEAALRAVLRRGAHVNSALAPDDRS